jgi:predicted nucleic acid-binding protein
LIVIDASAVVDLLLQVPDAAAIEARLVGSRGGLHAPHLIDVEIASVLRRQTAKGEIDAHRGHATLADLADFPLTRYPHAPLLPRLWQLRHTLTAYDAAYVALAEALDAPLITRDRRLAAATGHRAKVEVI